MNNVLRQWNAARIIRLVAGIGLGGVRNSVKRISVSLFDDFLPGASYFEHFMLRVRCLCLRFFGESGI